MNTYMTLLKVDLLNSLAINNATTKRKKVKRASRGPLVGIIVTFVVLFLVMLLYGFILGMMARGSEYSYINILFGFTLGMFTSFMMSFGKSYSILFQARDYDLLGSMPIKNSTIISSKFSSYMLVNLAYFNVAYIPNLIIAFALNGVSLVNLLVGLLFIIIGPLFICTLSTFLGTIVGMVLQRSKFKNLISVIAYALFMVAIFFLSFSISSMASSNVGAEEEVNLVMCQKIFEGMKQIFLSDFALSAYLGDPLKLLYIVLLSILPLVVLIFFVSKVYVRLNERSKETYKNKNFKLDVALNKIEKDSAQSTKGNKGLTLVLLKRELKLISSYNATLVNTLVGPLLSAISSVVMLFQLSEIEMSSANERTFIVMLIVTSASLIMGILPSGAFSISLEGKRLWIIKTAPVDDKKVLFAKSFVFVLLCIPSIIIVSTVCAIVLKLSVLNIVFMPIVMFINVMVYSNMALWINCLFPKLNWNNPAEISKGGLGSILTMLIDMGLDVIMFVPALILSFTLGWMSWLVCLFFSSIGLLVSSLLVYKVGLRRYRSLSA